jgi:ppGpp synthetase/RelA/SpoT-type nucleotidyltranferase
MSDNTPLLNDEVIEVAVARYWREHDRYVKLANRVGDICRTLMTENTIRAQVTYRAKDPDSLRGKLRKYKASEAESRLLTTPEAIFARVGDLAGVRIATYEERDRDAVTLLLEGAFAGPDGEAAPRVEVKNKHETDRSNFYRATHCEVVLPVEELVGLYDNLKGLSCEVQVCSMLAHVWNEIEHDLRYKQLSGSLSPDEQELIQQLGHLTIAGDSTIRLLIAAVDKRQRSQRGEFTDAFDFVARLREKYPALTEFGRHAQQLYDELHARGLHSPAKIEELVGGKRIEDLQADVDKFHQWLQSKGGYRESGHLARKGADVLLMALLSNSSQEILNSHPAGRGQGRPPRIAWLARRYLEMTGAV